MMTQPGTERLPGMGWRESLVPPGNTALGGWPALKSWEAVRCALTAPGPGPHLAIRAGSGKSVPIRRESHTVDKAAVVLQERAQLPT